MYGIFLLQEEPTDLESSNQCILAPVLDITAEVEGVDHVAAAWVAHERLELGSG